MPLGCTDRQRISGSYQLAKVNNLLWMIQFSILPKSTPMWVGWNAQYRIDKKATEKIWYLPAINQTPTLTVVKEIMKRAQRLAMECGKREIDLTYDFACNRWSWKPKLEKHLHSITSLLHLDHFIPKWPSLVWSGRTSLNLVDLISWRNLTSLKMDP